MICGLNVTGMIFQTLFVVPISVMKVNKITQNCIKLQILTLPIADSWQLNVKTWFEVNAVRQRQNFSWSSALTADREPSVAICWSRFKSQSSGFVRTSCIASIKRVSGHLSLLMGSEMNTTAGIMFDVWVEKHTKVVIRICRFLGWDWSTVSFIWNKYETKNVLYRLHDIEICKSPKQL